MAAFMPPATSANLLAQLAIPGNDEAWKRFVENYRGFTEFSCRKAGLQEVDVQEITSRVLFALYKRLPQFRYDPAKRFRGYLTRVIRNEIITYFQEINKCPGAKGKGATGKVDLQTEFVLPSELEMIAVEADQHIYDGLFLMEKAFQRVQGLVEPITWEIFKRTALLAEEAPFVAQSYGKTVDAVYMAKSRTLKLIRKEIEKLCGEPGREKS